jgi:hypothetical protein
MNDRSAMLGFPHQFAQSRNHVERRRVDTTSFLITRVIVKIRQGLLVRHAFNFTTEIN